MPLWTPSLLPTAPDLWIDASDSATLFDAVSGGSAVAADGEVARAEDKSGNARHATQATSTNRAIRKLAQINGRDVMRFDGTNDEYNLVSFSQVLPCSAFVVANTTLLGSGYRVFLDRTVGASPYPPAFYLGIDVGQGRPGVYWGTSTLASWASNSLTTALTEFRLSASDVGVRINAGTEQTAAHSRTELTSWTKLANAAFQQSRFDLGEVIVCQYAMTAADRERVQGYLAHRWGLAASLPALHPYRDTAPQVIEPGPLPAIGGGLVHPLGGF